jgi:hypothetical protein
VTTPICVCIYVYVYACAHLVLDATCLQGSGKPGGKWGRGEGKRSKGGKRDVLGPQLCKKHLQESCTPRALIALCVHVCTP